MSRKLKRDENGEIGKKNKGEGTSERKKKKRSEFYVFTAFVSVIGFEVSLIRDQKISKMRGITGAG